MKMEIGNRKVKPLCIALLLIISILAIVTYLFKMGVNRDVNVVIVIILMTITYCLATYLERANKNNPYINAFDAEHNSSILYTLKAVFLRNVLEIFGLTCIGTLLLLIFTFWVEHDSKINSNSLSPTIIGLSLSIVSVMITIVGMFYAFLAEKRAHQSEQKSQQSLDASNKLLEEKSVFLDGFSGFINRINGKLNPHNNGIIADITNSSEEYHYKINCMFLTPFLGHAGITSDNMKLHRSLYELQSYMNQLIESNFAEVKMLCLDERSLVNWYAQIQWIEEVKKTEYAKFKDISPDTKRILLETVLNDLQNKKGGGSLQMNNDASEVESFSSFKNKYQAKYDGKKDGIPKLQICHTSYIPFQLFLVMKHKNRSKGDTNIKSGNLEGKFVVLSFVGDKTYFELIKDMTEGKHDIKGGIENLLDNLHAAVYSEDPRMCKILYDHFEHYWDDCKYIKHYPDVDDSAWTKLSKDCLPPTCFSDPADAVH